MHRLVGGCDGRYGRLVHPIHLHHDEPDTLSPATAAAFDADVPGVAVAPSGEFLPGAALPSTVVHDTERERDDRSPVS